MFFLKPVHGQDEVVSFGVEITSCLPVAFIWNDFDQALRNSQQSELWPQESSQVLGSGIQEKTEIEVTYYFNFFIQPTYKYEIVNVIPGQHFRYLATPEHPFRGGANLEFFEHGTGSRLLWEGEYLVSADQGFAKNAFLKFSKDFFYELTLRFQEVEKTRCSRPPLNNVPRNSFTI